MIRVGSRIEEQERRAITIGSYGPWRQIAVGERFNRDSARCNFKPHQFAAAAEIAEVFPAEQRVDRGAITEAQSGGVLGDDGALARVKDRTGRDIKVEGDAELETEGS